MEKNINKKSGCKLSDEQIKQIASAIDPKDVLAYIENHKEEYEEFLKSKKLEESDK